MQIFYFPRKSAWRKYCLWALSAVCFAGFLLGVVFGPKERGILFSLMIPAVSLKPSIISLLGISILPFFLCAIAFMNQTPAFALPVVFLKAFLFTYIGIGIYGAFSDCGWMIRLLFLFSESVSLPLLLGFCCHYVCGSRKLSFAAVAYLASTIFFTVAIDYLYISPFLSGLMTNQIR